MRAGVIVFPGSNCDNDVARALARVSDRPPQMIWYQETTLPKLDVVVLPGGFAYGDYLRPGAIAAHSPVMRAVKGFADGGGLVIGICNGFQVLTEAGMLPGILLQNADLKFICKDVYCRVETRQSRFTSGYDAGDVVRLPIAHNEGNYFADDITLDRLRQNDCVVFTYCDAEGKAGADANPNGSARNIAGIVNERRNILGMMPHPERAADSLLGGVDGRPFFEGLMAA
jgi:phosphoribosylformylglycinamidine synthase subunit PurQ / glutaminase